MILSGLRVVELASVLAGPSVGMWLAELGAQVIKVEHHRQGGDVTRSWHLATENPSNDRPAYFTAVNWGKSSIGVDLRQEDGRSLLLELIRKADIVIASFKPGDAEKLEVDYHRLSSINPRLIYADLTAFGTGDDRVGFDAIVQAEAGYTFMNGQPNSEPVKMPVALMDVLAAHQLKQGILLALLERGNTGKGQHVRTSLLHSGLAALVNQATNYLVAGKIPQAIGSDHPNIVPYGTLFTTADQKQIVLAVGNDHQFRRLCAILEPGLWEEEALQTNAGRVKHRHHVQTRLQQAIREWERDVLLAELRSNKVPAGAVRDMQEVWEQPGVERQVLTGEVMRGLRSVALEGQAQIDLSEPPHLGEQTDQIARQDLNLSESEIADLRKRGILG